MSKSISEIDAYVMDRCQDEFDRCDLIATKNTQKIINAFRDLKVSAFHFNGSTGYGYDDAGREKLDDVFARVFGAEAGLVRPHFVSGTHALATVLIALLKSGDELLSVAGTPYDTMQTVIGITGNASGNLLSKGVIYREVPINNYEVDLQAVDEYVNERTKVVLIQRSRGYSERKSLSIADIKKIIEVIKVKKRDVICFVDNCYGEFTEEQEPIEVGADIMAGSLIKNAGGGLAPTGGYIVGKQALVDEVAHSLTAPGLGNEMGSYTPGYRLFFQGLFLAPHVVSQAVKGACFLARFFSELGFDVSPWPSSVRTDLIQTVYLKNSKNLLAFCEGVQACSPVDSYAKPVPAELPGYEDPVIMACGAFVQGSSIELSADAPMREPYLVYWQGGLSFEHCRLAVMEAAMRVRECSK